MGLDELRMVSVGNISRPRNSCRVRVIFGCLLASEFSNEALFTASSRNRFVPLAPMDNNMRMAVMVSGPAGHRVVRVGDRRRSLLNPILGCAVLIVVLVILF